MNTRIHLSEEDLDDFLIGAPSAFAAAHVSACEPCGDRLTAAQTSFRGEMTAFNQATFAWSEARSNTIPRDLSAHRMTPRLTLNTIWATSAATVAALAFAVSAALHPFAPAAGPMAPAPAGAASAAPVQAEEIASDNAMLAAIATEIHTPRPARFGLYENTETHVAPGRRAVSQQVRD
jgi:hypothetical protein